MKRPEQDLQIKMVKAALLAFPDIRNLLYHNPNGSNTGAKMGGILKAMGRIAGIPDLCLIWDGKTHYFEIKTPDGKLSPEQKALHQLWERHGVGVHLVRNEVQLCMLIAKITGLQSRIKFADWQVKEFGGSE